MLESLKKEVVEANKLIVESGLVNPYTTFGNVSSIDIERRYVAIKPSGLSYKKLKPSDIVIVNLSAGVIIEGDKKPSSDTPTHLELYRSFQEINSIIHTHSLYATSFAQSKTPLRCLGTTHADYFNGDIPVINSLTEDEILNDYELNTGKNIVRYFKDKNINPSEVSACLVSSHGAFVWGENLQSALEKAIILEEIAKMNYLSINLFNNTPSLDESLRKKHYYRKHGPDAYYGQKK
ncbi:MAG: L-ribulose-5-phosphate 4-epimerase AraD [Nanoarchaeota archaeon]